MSRIVAHLVEEGSCTDRTRAAHQRGLAHENFFDEVGHGFNGPVDCLGILPSGALVATGIYSSYDAHPISGTAVVENDNARAIDADAFCLGMRADDDGGLLVVGSDGVRRITPAGQLDPTFAEGLGHALGQRVTRFEAIARRPDGGFVIGGDIRVDGRVIALGVFDADGMLDDAVTRQVTGTLDSLTSTAGGDTPARIISVASRSDGSFLVRGFSSRVAPLGGLCALRFDARGNLDPSYRPRPPDGIVCADDPATQGLVVGADGALLLVGTTPGRDDVASTPRLLRFRPDGTLDAKFVLRAARALSYSGRSGIETVAFDPSGRVFVGGVFSADDRSDCLLRLEADGTLDESFSAHARSWTCAGAASAVVVAPDGDVAIGGSFVLARGSQRRLNLARFASNGSPE